MLFCSNRIAERAKRARSDRVSRRVQKTGSRVISALFARLNRHGRRRAERRQVDNLFDAQKVRQRIAQKDDLASESTTILGGLLAASWRVCDFVCERAGATGCPANDRGGENSG